MADRCCSTIFTTVKDDQFFKQTRSPKQAVEGTQWCPEHSTGRFVHYVLR
jgi:hypothetical protein